MTDSATRSLLLSSQQQKQRAVKHSSNLVGNATGLTNLRKSPSTGTDKTQKNIQAASQSKSYGVTSGSNGKKSTNSTLIILKQSQGQVKDKGVEGRQKLTSMSPSKREGKTTSQHTLFQSMVPAGQRESTTMQG